MPKASSHFWWLPTSLSIVLSTLGILALARHAFVTWSVSAPLELVMAAYNATMQLLLGWAHPYLQAALTWLGSFIGWRPTLHPHWRDVFVVAGLLGVGLARAAWRQRKFHYLYSAASFVVGALVMALIAGMLPLQSNDLTTQLLIAASFGLGLLPFTVLRSVSKQNPGRLHRELLLALGIGAVAMVITGAFSLGRDSVAGLGLAGLAFCMSLVGVAMTNLASNADAHGVDRVLVETIGRTILGGFVGAAFVAAVDAGLKLLGA